MEAPRIALAQINTTVGDVAGNAALVESWAERARQEGARLVVFPELTLSGYPPEDLLLKPHFLDAVGAALDRLGADLDGIAALVGFPERADGMTYNAAALLRDGRVDAIYRKGRLPNYGVFDERRYFAESGEPLLFDLDGVRLGVTICEDDWFPDGAGARAATAGADAVVNLSASPYHAGKGTFREHEVIARRAREYGVPVVMCNLVGGQDELVFDGHSLAVGPDGATLASGAQFREELLMVDLERPSQDIASSLGRDEEVYEALVTGLRDYVAKNGFGHVVFGLSGGIDSALVAVLAVDALGPDQVSCAVMPSRYSADETQSDARLIARNLGIECVELEIEPAFEALRGTLAERFAGTAEGVAEENLQARIRGTLLMALSNKFGWLVLTTGNKSELSVGYSTLYGDLAGGFAVLKDVYKGTVYRLVRWRNERDTGAVAAIPGAVIERPPSAELRPDQTDQDSLPGYDTLDAILVAYVELDRAYEEIVADGHEPEVVRRVIDLVDAAEYKRRQAPPGVRISPRAFGRDRRMPITNRFRG